MLQVQAGWIGQHWSVSGSVAVAVSQEAPEQRAMRDGPSSYLEFCYYLRLPRVCEVEHHPT